MNDSNVIDSEIVPSSGFGNLAAYAPQNVPEAPSGGLSLPYLQILNNNSKYCSAPFNYPPGAMILVQGDEIIELAPNERIHLVDTINGQLAWPYDDKTGKKLGDKTKGPVCKSNNAETPLRRFWETEDEVKTLYDPRPAFDEEKYKAVKKDPTQLKAFIDSLDVNAFYKGVEVPIVENGCPDCRMRQYIKVPKIERGKIVTDAKGQIVLETRAPICGENPRYILWLVDHNRPAIFQVFGMAVVHARGRAFSKNADGSQNKQGEIKGFSHWYNPNEPKWVKNEVPYPVVLSVKTDDNNSANNEIYVPKLTLDYKPFTTSEWQEYTHWADNVYKALNGHAILSGERAPQNDEEEVATTPKVDATDPY